MVIGDMCIITRLHKQSAVSITTGYTKFNFTFFALYIE
jgi:hypothetical protein